MSTAGPLRLGSLELASRFILAPLESVSDAPFRRLCWSLGAGFTWTEMIRARGLARNNKSTLDLIDSHDPEVPTGLQLMVANERELQEALERLDTLAATTHPHFKNLSAIDLNFGCPSPEVIRIGAGPALLKRRGKLRTIFETLGAWKKATPLRIGAVGAKLRLGLHRLEADQEVYLPIIDAANESLDYVVLHARHARQTSDEQADWQAIAKAKARATIPLIGNGDVFTVADAERLFRETGCDGALIARAAIRSPWVFRELTGRGPGQPTLAELDDAERTYLAEATRLGSKPKFIEWHREGFGRIRARLAGRPATGSDVPRNDHMAPRR